MADQNNPGQFGNRKDTEQMAKKGGESQGQENNPGNFANRSKQDVKRAAEKGGEHSHGGGRPSDQ